MTLLNMTYVVFGGAVGSMLRYLSVDVVGRLHVGHFPFGTLLVNVLGSFLMGAWIAFVAYYMPTRGRDLHLLFAVGMLGGFTTFSAFSLDVFFLVERGDYVLAALYAGGSVLLSVAALIGGMLLVRLVF